MTRISGELLKPLPHLNERRSSGLIDNVLLQVVTSDEDLMNVMAVRVEGNTLQQDQSKSKKEIKFFRSILFMPLIAAYILHLSDIYFYMHEIVYTEFFRQFKRLSREIL